MPRGILSMFPLPVLPENPPSTPVPQPPSNTNLVTHLCPKQTGKHIENYTTYRANSKLPPVLSRLVQRGAKMIGVKEATLRYSTRWFELKLYNAGRNGHGNDDTEMLGTDNEAEIVGL
jgi:hypothetical protein